MRKFLGTEYSVLIPKWDSSRCLFNTPEPHKTVMFSNSRSSRARLFQRDSGLGSQSPIQRLVIGSEPTKPRSGNCGGYRDIFALILRNFSFEARSSRSITRAYPLGLSLKSTIHILKRKVQNYERPRHLSLHSQPVQG